MSGLPLIGNLTDVQAEGFACVVCRTDYLAPGAPPSTVVGRSVVSAQVFACVGRKRCAEKFTKERQGVLS